MAKQERLSNEEFLTRLAQLLKSQSSSTGSVHLTQKRLSHPSEAEESPSPQASASTPFADLSPSTPLPVLIRATNGKSREKGKKVKLATVVQPDELDGFFVRYGEVWRKEMGGLKKRDRKKKRKEKKGGDATAAKS